ncbi:hypothetical protein ULMS_24610 [Patiriisocius marinistellae]|uniref:GTPase n=2 Tax=Patiriisocius marinistellae TaxID=2494560 RepID=A0A5J4FY16_9FLAO|nr:hypothetical protein ULMS_24610 [Patiriisocius marinistellae]
MVSPSTYDCRLCDVTFGFFAEKEEWKEFRETSNLDMVFLHKDEFLKKYRSKWLAKYTFPVILQEEGGELFVFINTPTLNIVENTTQLMTEINERV